MYLTYSLPCTQVQLPSNPCFIVTCSIIHSIVYKTIVTFRSFLELPRNYKRVHTCTHVRGLILDKEIQHIDCFNAAPYRNYI